MMLLKVIFYVAYIKFIFGEDLEEGESCEPTQNVSEGKCQLVTDCRAAVSYIIITRNHPFTRCGFKNDTEVVCCPLVKTSGSECKKIVDNSLPPQAVHILGGEDAQPGEFPHMVAIGSLINGGVYYFYCGGSLISEFYVLTAAHCISNADHTTASVARLGAVERGNNTFNPETDIRIARVHVYPEYRTVHKYHDLALLRLSEAAQYSATVLPACLHTAPTVPAVPLTVTGWGKISDRKDIRSEILQKADISEVTNSECQKHYKSNIAYKLTLPKGIISGQMCAIDPQGHSDTCLGDSGGPLQALSAQDGYYRVIGVTSFGQGCASSVPGVYTRVFSYLDWIEQIVWPNKA